MKEFSTEEKEVALEYADQNIDGAYTYKHSFRKGNTTYFYWYKTEIVK